MRVGSRRRRRRIRRFLSVARCVMPSLAAHAAPVRPLHASLPPHRRLRRLRSQLRCVRSVWFPGGVGSRLVAVFLLVIRDEVHASSSREDARSRVVSSFAAHAARFDTVTDPWWFRSFGLVVGLTPTPRGGFGLGRLGSGPGDSRARGAVDVVVGTASDMVIAPESGSSKPAMARNSVVFPQPEGPRSAKNSLAAMSTLTSSRATTGP